MNAAARSWAIATLLAAAGGYLAVDAWLAGGLLRYVLVGVALGALLAAPLLTLLLLRARARRFWRKVVFACVPLVALLLVAELGMRLFGPAPELPAALRADARLGHVVAPGTGGTDRDGWRNAHVADACDVLFVGDSQTWGFGVRREQAFSAVFAARSGRACYQMATGSYGPVQHRELVRRGLRRGPRLVVVGIYFGNDLVDAVDYAALDGAADLRAGDYDYALRPFSLGEPRTPNAAMWLVDRARAGSRLIGAAAQVAASRLQGGVLDRQAGALAFERGETSTILLPDYRCGLLDPARPNVAEGVAVTSRSLAAIAADCRAAGADCVVLAIPTKEFTYAELQAEAAEPLERLRAAERDARALVFAAAAAAGLPVVDLAPKLTEALRDGDMPWFASGDGHLAVRGHELAAEALLQARTD